MNWLEMNQLLLDVSRGAVGFAANWLLQSTLLIAAGLFAAWIVRSRGSAVQSAIYRTTLAGVLLCPLATGVLAMTGASGWSLPMPAAWTYTPPGQLPAGPLLDESPTTAVGTDIPDTRGELDSNEPGVGMTFDRQPPFEDEQTLATSGPHADTNATRPTTVNAMTPLPASTTVSVPTAVFEVHVFGLVAFVLFSTWLLVSGALLLRLTLAWQQLTHICRRSIRAVGDTQDSCRELARVLDVCPPDVRLNTVIPSPCLAGIVRPVILLPGDDYGLSLRDVLVHELAHLKRRDCHWHLLRQGATAVFFFQPLLWRLAHRMEFTAEEVCDDFVVQFGGNRKEYAHRLVDIAEFSSVGVSKAGVGIVTLRSMLGKRVARILDTSRSLSTRVGLPLLFAVVLGGLLGTAVVGFVGLGAQPAVALAAEPDEPKDNQENEAATTSGQSTSDDVKPKPSEVAFPEVKADQQGNADTHFIQGTVIGADGNVVADARLYWFRGRVHDIQPMKPVLLATSDKQGKYRFPASAVTSVDAKEPASWEYHNWFVATAPGHGFARVNFGEVLTREIPPTGLLDALAKAFAAADDATISLPATAEPIRGRLVDIDGQPVVGAQIRICWFNTEDLGHRTFDTAVEQWNSRVNYLLNVIEPVQLREILPSATTDNNGRFELHGVAGNMLVQLLVQGDAIEATELVVRNEPGDPITIEPNHQMGREGLTLYGREFLHAMGPSKPVEGRVLDVDSGEPIANAVVRVFKIHGINLWSSREREHLAVQTDAQGRYRITGLPIGDDNKLVAFTMGDIPYVPVGQDVDTSLPGKTTRQDIRLKRGVWAEGTVFDGESKKPFVGEITYYYFRKPELEEQYPGIRRAYLDGRYWTNAAGEFRLPVLPSRGIVAFRYSGNNREEDNIDRYARGQGADAIEGLEDQGGLMGFPTAPSYLTPINYERVAEVNPQPGQETVHIEMPLHASQPINVQVVDESGQPVFTRFQVYGAGERSSWQQMPGPSFEITDLKPKESRKVFVFHRERNLAGATIIEQGGENAVEIKLGKAGSLRGRVLNERGEPIEGATILSNYEKLLKDKTVGIWAPAKDQIVQPGQIPVDGDGRFQLDGLVPGWKYSAFADARRKFNGIEQNVIIGTVFDGVQVQPGEVKDLGDIVIPPTPGFTEVSNPKQSKRDAVTAR